MGLDSTQDVSARRCGRRSDRRFTRHLEIETYTWDVLPAALKIDVSDSITREYRWVLESARMHKTVGLNVVAPAQPASSMSSA